MNYLLKKRNETIKESIIKVIIRPTEVLFKYMIPEIHIFKPSKFTLKTNLS